MTFVPLTQAVTSGDPRAVSAALSRGAEVNERTGGGQTPLILATIFGHTHLIPLLLEAGADPQLRDNLGLNAIDWAQRRGATEAIAIFTNKRKPITRRTETVAAPPPRPSAPVTKPSEETETPLSVSADERSRRWIEGLKQRIAEQSSHETAMPLPEPKPETQIETKSIDEVPRSSPKPPSSSKKRCPKCNAVYDSPLLAYCAHHIVPLVDADEPIITEPPKTSPVMFWMIIVITLTGSIVVASLISTYVYNSPQPSREAAASTQAPAPVQKGIPIVSRELTGRVVSLPVAESPLNGQEAIPGTVVVKVLVDKSGQVKSARATGGDWLLRGAATEAAMKSTFDAEKLRARQTEGTITYTFQP